MESSQIDPVAIVGAMKELCALFESRDIPYVAPSLNAAISEMRGALVMIDCFEGPGGPVKEDVDVMKSLLQTYGFSKMLSVAHMVATKLEDDPNLADLLQSRLRGAESRTALSLVKVGSIEGGVDIARINEIIDGAFERLNCGKTSDPIIVEDILPQIDADLRGLKGNLMTRNRAG